MNPCMRSVSVVLLVALLACTSACKSSPPSTSNDTSSAKAPENANRVPEGSDAPTSKLAQARKNFRTVLVSRGEAPEPADIPPPDAPFRLVKYPAPVGQLAAYITPDPGDGKQHAAMIWITGGDCNSIGNVWSGFDERNEQSASAFRRAGMAMMFPSLRGGNDNPGRREGFLGEVDDILAATDYLAALPWIDPSRIYLGGHSTGGTLVLLAAAQVGTRYRAVFSFGPVDDVAGYGGNFIYCDPTDQDEMRLRSPIFWLDDIKVPTWVIEGERDPSNVSSLNEMKASCKNPLVRFRAVPGASHFSVLGPVNSLIASRLLDDTVSAATFDLTESELAAAFQ